MKNDLYLLKDIQQITKSSNQNTFYLTRDKLEVYLVDIYSIAWLNRKYSENKLNYTAKNY